MLITKSLDKVNEFTIFKILTHCKKPYVVVKTADIPTDRGWEFKTLPEAVRFCDHENPCLLIIAPKGDDGNKKMYVYKNQKKALKKIEKKYTIPDSFYDTGVMKIGKKGYIALEAFHFGKPLGVKKAKTYLKRGEK